MRCGAMRRNPNGAAARWSAMADSFVRRSLTSMVIAVAAFGWAGPLAAQTYPVRPIKMIVPFPAGGAPDTRARDLAKKMEKIWGLTSNHENGGGTGGSFWVGRAVPSPADGYTLSIGTSTTHMLTGGLYTLPFDLLTDLEPVIQIGRGPLFF